MMLYLIPQPPGSVRRL